MTDSIREIEAEISQEKPYNAADEKQVNEARKKAGRKRVEKLNIVKAIMELQEGRRWLHDLMMDCHIFESGFFYEETHKTAFSMGERNVGLRILAQIMDAAPELYITMCKENKK